MHKKAAFEWKAAGELSNALFAGRRSTSTTIFAQFFEAFAHIFALRRSLGILNAEPAAGFLGGTGQLIEPCFHGGNHGLKIRIAGGTLDAGKDAPATGDGLGTEILALA